MPAGAAPGMASSDSCSSAPASLVWRATLAAAAAKQQQGANGWDAPIICLPEPSVYTDRATLCRLAALLSSDGEAAQVVDSDWRAASSWSPGHLPVPTGNTVQPSDVSGVTQGCITRPGLKQSAADPAALVSGALAAFEQAVSVLCLDVGGVAVVHDPESLLPVLWVRGDMLDGGVPLPMPRRVRNFFSVASQVVNDCLLRDFQLSRRDVEAALVQTGLLPAPLSCYSSMQNARAMKPRATPLSPNTHSTAAPVSAVLDCAATTTTGSSTASHMAVVQHIPSNVREAVKPGSFCPRAVVRRLVSQLLAWQSQPTGVVAAAAQSEAFYCTGRGFTMPVMTSVQLLATDLNGLPPLLTLATFHTGQAPRPLRHLPMPQHVLRAVQWGHRAQWRGVKRPRPVHPAPPSASPLQADATAGSGDEPLPILGAPAHATDEGSLLRALYPRATCQALLSASISPFDAAGEAAATAEGLLPLPPPSHLHTLAHTARAVGEDDGGLALAAGRGGGDDGGGSMRGGASAGAALKLQRLHAATARSGPALPPGVTLAATSQAEGTVVSVPGASVRVGGRRPVRPTPTHAGYAVGRALSPAPFPAPLGPSAATVQV